MRSVGEIDLVPVVGGGIVRCRDLHARNGAQRPYREGGHRGGERLSEGDDLEAGRGENLCRGGVEFR